MSQASSTAGISASLSFDNGKSIHTLKLRPRDGDTLVATVSEKEEKIDQTKKVTFTFSELVYSGVTAKLNVKQLIFKAKDQDEIVQKFVDQSTDKVHMKLVYNVKKGVTTVFGDQNGELKKTRTVPGYVPLVVSSLNGKLVANLAQ